MADRPLPAYEGDAPYIFVCYGHADADIVHPEIRWLQDQGFNVWWDEGIDPGTVWREGLAKAIKDSSLFLFFVTPNSVASAHCLRELNFSQEEQKPFLYTSYPGTSSRTSCVGRWLRSFRSGRRHLHSRANRALPQARDAVPFSSMR